ncbi:MAG TPA: apolipoprotein N-acyltransferase [Xanthobacteraceae bacterium]|nr:apolipoprotein N-acyltransferase [Xanthobacteraceae bacterium]
MVDSDVLHRPQSRPLVLQAALRRPVRSVVVSRGWRRAAIAFGAGAISVLAVAPFHAWPLLFATFPVLVWLIDGAGAGRWGRTLAAALAGWWFGFGYFLAGLYWVGAAFLVDAKTFGWLMPFAVVGLPAYLALFTGLGAGVASLLWTSGPVRILALAAAMTLAEWLRGHLLTGFPWNAFGYALTEPLALAQGAALVGLWGLTFIAVAVFASPAVLADGAEETRRPWLPLIFGLAVLASLATYGAVRLAATPTAFVEDVKLRIMQPNLPQDTKFNYAAKQQVMARYLRLSNQTVGPGRQSLQEVTHLVWPESAFPFLLAREPDALAQLAELLPAGTVLITGAARGTEAARGSGALQAHNSIYVIDHDGSVLSVYDKVHLVPFGEFLPAQPLLERLGLMQLTKVPGGFTPGDRRRLLTMPGAPAAVPLICYEIIFPGAVAPKGERPAWLLNLTNDGWFGSSTGPYQHFQQARVRAIEEGIPLVRAANTGISAVVDPLGRVVKSLPLGAEGVLDADLPRAAEATVFARYRDWWTVIMLLASILFCVRARSLR